MVIWWSNVISHKGFIGRIQRQSRAVGHALVALVAFVAAGEGLAQEARPGGAALHDAARAVIERHCARCHQSDRMVSERPQGGIVDILALDDAAREGVLVRPGLPEASALFNVLYTGHPPGGYLSHGSNGEPAADEIAAVRDWILSLAEDRDGGCKERRLGPAHAPAAVARAIAASDRNRRKSLRFVSLVHLADSCRSAREIADHVQAIRWVVSAASRTSVPFEPRLVDAEGRVLDLDLERLGWDAQAWEQLTARFPLAGLPPFELGPELLAELGTRRAIVSADWLASALLEPATSAALLGRVMDGAGPGDNPLDGLASKDRALIAALAALYARPVTVRVAAAEAGLTPQQLDQQLLLVGGSAAFGARRLRQAAISRSEVLRVYAALLEGGPAGGHDTSGDSPGSQPRIAVWADRDTYATGQALSLQAETDSACHLSLINVDARGRATVLFPNGFEPDNLLQPRQRITVPGVDAPYRFRLSERGRETVIGICTATARAIDGIRHDFDRLYFTVLGDWLGFQIRAYEDVGKPVPPERERRRVRRRGQRAAPVVEVPRRGSEVQARTAFTIDVQ